MHGGDTSSFSVGDLGPGLPFSEHRFPCWIIILLRLWSLGTRSSWWGTWPSLWGPLLREGYGEPGLELAD